MTNRMRTFTILLICLGLNSCEKDKREYPRTIETEAWEDVKINEKQYSCPYVCCAVGNDKQLETSLGGYLLTTLITANSETECKELLERIAADIYLMPPPL